MINITLKIEGLREKKGIPFQAETGTTVFQAIKEIAESSHEDSEVIRNSFFNKKDNSVGVYMVLVNSEMVHQSKFDSFLLKDGDVVTIIMPIAGG